LAVEDDPMVRNYVIAQLHGYTTIAAENAAVALAVVRHGASFDLPIAPRLSTGHGGQCAITLAGSERSIDPVIRPKGVTALTPPPVAV
jgi:CheY-like chemotaxis protein